MNRFCSILSTHAGKTGWLWLALWLNCPTICGAALVWESKSLQLIAPPEGSNIQFAFRFTNNSADELVIREISPSCGCTVLNLPPMPWRLAPGVRGIIEGNLDLQGKRGVLYKTITVQTSTGAETLECRVTIPEVLGERREQNIKLARADRQAVFKGDCVRCHVDPGKGKSGMALYASACGICHDAEHRAAMVPLLADVGGGEDRAYWEHWIRHGREGSLMPAFAKADGGILDEAQIVSLIDLLRDRYRVVESSGVEASASPAAQILRLPPLPAVPVAVPTRGPDSPLVPIPPLSSHSAKSNVLPSTEPAIRTKRASH